MKTHDVARILSSLAAVLRKGPNVPLDDLANIPRASSKKSELPVALSALVALSEFRKSQWEAVIEEYRLPIQVHPAQSGRDIVGKILQHLAKDPESRRRLRVAAERTRSDISPELMNALNSILK